MSALTDLWFDAQFLGEMTVTGHRHIDGIEGAQGLFLWCPCGFGKSEFPLDGGRPHGVIVPFSNPRNAPQLDPNVGPHTRNDPNSHPRWTMSDASVGLANLTLTPSIDVGAPTSCWHGFIADGQVK